MSKKEKEQKNQAVEIEDLNLEDAAQQEVKGGSNNLRQIGLASINLADSPSTPLP